MSSLFDTIWSVLGTGTTAGPATYANPGAKIWPLSTAAREDLKKGVAYHMKVVLRGMRGVGKTTLLARLCGHPLPAPTYCPSAEITASTRRFLGADCAPHEGTRVDIWDVVDEGSAASRDASTQQHLPGGADVNAAVKQQLRLCADARSIDVYSRCHCAIFVIDCTNAESLEYAVEEISNVPLNTTVVLALNKLDEPKEKHTVSASDVVAVCHTMRRTASRMVTRLCVEGAPPPTEYSFPPCCACVSARTGHGIPELLQTLNVANTMLRIEEREAQVYDLYQRAAGYTHRAQESALQPPAPRARQDGGPGIVPPLPPPAATEANAEGPTSAQPSRSRRSRVHDSNASHGDGPLPAAEEERAATMRRAVLDAGLPDDDFFGQDEADDSDSDSETESAAVATQPSDITALRAPRSFHTARVAAVRPIRGLAADANATEQD